MPTVVTTDTVDDEELEAVLRPRTGLILERPAGDGRFEAEQGFVRTYTRTVTVEPVTDEPGRHRVHQVVDYWLAMPFIWFLFHGPVKRHVRRLVEPAVPWWAPPDRMDMRAGEVFGCLCLLSAISVYPGFLLTQTITFAADELGVGKGAQGLALGAVRLDFVIAIVVVSLADRRGRRELMLRSAAIGCGVIALGALAPELWSLTAIQIVGRGFIAAATILIGIVAAEEMPAGSRAYVFGVMAIAGALGAGAVLTFLPVADVDEHAWRILFVLTILGVPLLRPVARHLPESRRFRAPHQEVAMAGHGGRFWLLAVSALLLALFVTPASQFTNEFLRDERGYSAARISLFTIATNVPGGIGIFVGGYLADVRGRRLVGGLAVAGGVGATAAMFLSSGWQLWAWSVVGAVLGAATVPAIGVYGPELFPTSLRGKANGIISGLGRVGSVIGLVATGFLSERLDGLGRALALLAVGPAVVVVLILTAYPETAHRELEELNPEDQLG